MVCQCSYDTEYHLSDTETPDSMMILPPSQTHSFHSPNHIQYTHFHLQISPQPHPSAPYPVQQAIQTSSNQPLTLKPQPTTNTYLPPQTSPTHPNTMFYTHLTTLLAHTPHPLRPFAPRLLNTLYPFTNTSDSDLSHSKEEGDSSYSSKKSQAGDDSDSDGSSFVLLGIQSGEDDDVRVIGNRKDDDVNGKRKDSEITQPKNHKRNTNMAETNPPPDRRKRPTNSPPRPPLATQL